MLDDKYRIESLLAVGGMGAVYVGTHIKAMQSTYTPYVARKVIWTPSGAFVDGGIDDVRVFTGALPCE